MLQQTQVATVIPFYQRFLRSFPNIKALAGADESSLLSHWEGLGYYRRARSMHAAAKEVVARHGGTFPQTFEEVVALPGIGRYTAGAILSIALDQRLPILEGNTQRVFARWIAMRGDVTRTPATSLLWEVSERMLPRASAGTFNQAAMELGALVCTAKNPACDSCPVRGLCAAHRDGSENEIPGKVSRISYEDRIEFAFIVQQPGRACYLLRPLPEGARWAGLWDFPRSTDVAFKSANSAARHLSKEMGFDVDPVEKLTTIRHAVTKYRILLEVHRAQAAEGLSNVSLPEPWRFVDVAEMGRLAMSVTGRKIANMLPS